MEEIIAPPSDDNANFTKYFNTNNAKCAILGRMSEKTILFFHTSVRQAWIKELDGAYRFARAKGWRVQVIEPTKRPPSIQKLIDFWHPLGCVAECSGTPSDHFDPSAFGDLPPPDGTVASADGRLAVEIPEKGMVFLTTDYVERVPSPVRDVKVADGRLTWTAADDPDHCYYRVYANGRQIASTVATARAVKDADAEYAVVSVDRWGNAGNVVPASR